MSKKRLENLPSLGGQGSRSGREPRLGGEIEMRNLALSLESDNWDTRRAAGLKLLEKGDEAITLLAGAMASRKDYTRSIAAQTLGLIGGEQAVEVLIGALNDDQFHVRSDASKGLMRLAGGMAHIPLRTHVVRALLEQRRRFGAKGTGVDISTICEVVVLSLIDLLLDEDAAIAYDAWRLLRDSQTLLSAGQSRIKRATTMLESLVCTTDNFPPDEILQLKAARAELVARLRALIETQEDAAEQERLRSELSAYRFDTLVPLARAQAQSSEPIIRAVAICRLGLAQDIASTGLIVELLVRDPSIKVRCAAPEALLWMSEHDAVPVLERVLLQDRQPGVRDAILSAMRGFDINRAITMCLDLALTDSEGWAQRSALGKIRAALQQSSAITPQVAQQIFELCERSLTRSSDIAILVVPALAALMRHSEVGETILAAASEVLIRLTRHDWVSMRGSAIRQLTVLPPNVAIPVLIEHLTDETNVYGPYLGAGWHWPTRICDSAAYMLEQIGTPEALAAVESWRSENGPWPVVPFY